MIIVVLLVLAVAPFASAGYPCGNATDQKYHANTELLSAMLQKNASSTPLLFAKGSVGAVPDTVHGLALCRGDKNASSCSACVAASFQKVLQLCPFPRVEFVYSDDCLVHFSDLDILENAKSSELDDLFIEKSTVNIMEPSSPWYPSDADRVTIVTMIKALLQQTAKLAAYNTTRRYATGSMDVDAFASMLFPILFSMAQCMPDLTSGDCWSCLKNITEVAVATDKVASRLGNHVFRLRCNLRYEAYMFYDGEPMQYIGSSDVAALPKPAAVASRKHKISVIAVVVPLLALFICAIVSFGFIGRHRKGKGSLDKAKMHVKEDEALVWGLEGRGSEFTVYDFSQVLEATSNFSEENKLGQGGFGPVYMGRFHDGLEIAVKRLASHSGQGFTEFKNEIQLIAKLQHTNLVRLLGCCSQGDEKLLIYEYLPNKSLDFFIFDETRRALLGWTKRLTIIEGIAQGLLYLHRHSRLRVIHRDLKASNILLDREMNPKISDFGLAKIFSINDTEGNTKRIAGTYGYMAPEYASEGLFSIKSDVFSFGVLFLEIISGKRISWFHRYGDFINLLGHAWQLWKDGLWLELVDSSLDAECYTVQIMRFINIALLCVQENAVDRPTMSEVVVMLCSESMPLLEPKHPAYFHIGVATEQASAIVEPPSVNDITISVLRGR